MRVVAVVVLLFLSFLGDWTKGERERLYQNQGTSQQWLQYILPKSGQLSKLL